MKTTILFFISLGMALVACAPTARLIPTQTPLSPTASSIEAIAPIPQCGTSDFVSPTLKKLTFEHLRITLQYPADWTCDTSGQNGYDYYSGTDGFVHVLSTPLRDVQESCESQARHSIGKGQNLYGANPTTELLRVDNQPACLISPSADQPAYQRGLSMLLVAYPNADAKYGPLLVLTADKNHMRDFIDTLKFAR